MVDKSRIDAKNSLIKKDLRSPKYKTRVVQDKKKNLSKMKCRKDIEHE